MDPKPIQPHDSNQQPALTQILPTPSLQITQTQLESKQSHCNRCHSEINASYYFCPHCGHKIKEPPYHFSVISTTGILLLSFLFPPFGLIPGFKYLKNENKTAKFVGILAILVTIISCIIFALLIQQYLNMVNNTINSINSLSTY